MLTNAHCLLMDRCADLKDSVVVFDEAHNIDNVCIESMSVNIKKNHLVSASANIRELEKKVQQLRKDDQDKLKDEYRKLVQGLRTAREAAVTDAAMANPVLPTEVLEEAVRSMYRAEGAHTVRLLECGARDGIEVGCFAALGPSWARLLATA